MTDSTTPPTRADFEHALSAIALLVEQVDRLQDRIEQLENAKITSQMPRMRRLPDDRKTAILKHLSAARGKSQ